MVGGVGKRKEESLRRKTTTPLKLKGGPKATSACVMDWKGVEAGSFNSLSTLNITKYFSGSVYFMASLHAIILFIDL